MRKQKVYIRMIRMMFSKKDGSTYPSLQNETKKSTVNSSHEQFLGKNYIQIFGNLPFWVELTLLFRDFSCCKEMKGPQIISNILAEFHSRKLFELIPT